MRILSCKGCGCLLDGDVIVFPQIQTEEGYTEDAVWDDDGNCVSSIPCPICKTKVPEEN